MEKTDDFIGALLTDGFCNIVGNVSALDLNKVEEDWNKSMNIANTDLDNLDFDIPRTEEVEIKRNNENESYFFRHRRRIK